MERVFCLFCFALLFFSPVFALEGMEGGYLGWGRRFSVFSCFLSGMDTDWVFVCWTIRLLGLVWLERIGCLAG